MQNEPLLKFAVSTFRLSVFAGEKEATLWAAPPFVFFHAAPSCRVCCEVGEHGSEECDEHRPQARLAGPSQDS